MDDSHLTMGRLRGTRSRSRILLGMICYWGAMLTTASAVVSQEVIDADVQRRILEPLGEVPAVPRPPAWNGFQVFVWQYKTDARRDEPLMNGAGLRAFHIDRGKGQESRVAWAAEQKRPYYVDHAAGKGVLHLTPRMGRDQLRDDGTLQARPQSLLTQDSLDSLRRQLSENLAVVKQGPAAAIALDDEVSLGVFNSPYEVDASPASVRLFRQYLKSRYGSIRQLNQQWATDYLGFDEIQPTSFETVRRTLSTRSFRPWNLSPWVDWHAFMDTQFSAAIGSLVDHARQTVPGIPVGIVGGQQPSAYGGFDYEKLARQVQWLESYDIGGTNELLSSLWADSRKPIVQTFFATGNQRRDSWFLWYYWAHGNAAVIAWPEIRGQSWFADRKLLPEVARLRETFEWLQSERLASLSRQESRQVFDDVALLYSHSSIQASWATDALVHGKTWPRRSSSLDNGNNSAGRNRVAWNKLLEDVGIQARWVTETQVAQGELARRRVKVLILPRAIAISEATCQALETFVRQGGVLVADYWTALLDEHGKARTDQGQLKGRLDHLFGVSRDDEQGYFDGKSLTEVNGERYQRPFLQRLAHSQQDDQGLTVVELGTQVVPNSSAIYLNRSPVAYADSAIRLSDPGQAWRSRILRILASAGVTPAVMALQRGKPVPLIEVLRWKVDNRLWVVVVSNPTREAAINEAGKLSGAFETREVELRFQAPFDQAVNMLTGQSVSHSDRLSFEFDPGSAVIFEIR